MIDDNNIDDLFRSSLEDLELNPPEKSWDNIDHELSKKRLRWELLNRLKYLSVVVLLFIAGVVTYKYKTENDATAVNKKTVVTELKNNNQVETNNTGKSTPFTGNKKPVYTENKVHSKNSGTEAPIIQPASDFVASVNVNQPVQPKNNSADYKKDDSKKEIIHDNKNSSFKTTNENGKKIEPGVKSVKPSPADKTIVAETQTSVSKENKIASTENNLNEKTASLVVAEKNVSERQSATSNPEPALTGEKSITENITSGQNVPSNNLVEPSAPPQSILPVPPPPAPLTEPPKIASETQIKQPPVEPVKISSERSDYIPPQKNDSASSFIKKVASHLTAEIYFSPDYVNERLKVNDTYTGTASQDINDYDNQKAAFSYSTGLHVRYDLGKKWSIGSGVSYSTFAQTAVYNTINVVSDSAYQKEHKRPLPPPGGHMGLPSGGHHGGHNPHIPPGNNNHHYVIQTPCGAIDLYNVPPHTNGSGQHNGDTLNIKTETSELLQFINIPLTLRYQFGKGRFSYFLEGGAEINFVKGDKVKIVVDDAYVENNERDGLKNMNYSVLFGGGVQYNFYKGLNTYLKPSLRYSITPVNQDNPMYSYPYYIGIEAGFSIHF